MTGSQAEQPVFYTAHPEGARVAGGETFLHGALSQSGGIFDGKCVDADQADLLHPTDDFVSETVYTGSKDGVQ
jgi:hypothetical protein